MHRFGVISLYVGLVMALVGLIGGFGLMLAGGQTWSKPLIALVPIGFLLIFNGLVTILLHRVPGSKEDSQPKGPPD